MIVEICANGFESARIAHEAGADRIELCTDLSVGGLTPSHALIQQVLTQLSIPTHVLIRPRGGNFVWGDSEIDTMLQDIAFCRNAGCAGIVSGVLTSEGEIDVSTCRRLVAASQGMEFTFHRAFDYCKNPMEGLEQIIRLGATRVLTSGQKSRASDGLPLLKTLQQDFGNRIEIMPGGGINSENALQFKEAGFEMIHFSATKKESIDDSKTELLQNKVLGCSNPKEIKRIIQILA